jgi:hypothetical protein
MTRARLLSLVVFSVGLLGALGCPGKPESCIEDKHCAKDQTCHPVAKLCVKSCLATSDCDDDKAKICHTGGGGSRPYCGCDATEQCKEDGVICGAEEKICLDKCTNDVDCTFGRTCNRDTGQCTAAAPP